MNKLIIFLIFSCLPVTLIASDEAWISGNILYDDKNCGEPIAYVDNRGNILEEFPPQDDKAVSVKRPLSSSGL